MWQTSKLRFREAHSLSKFMQLRRAGPRLEPRPAWRPNALRELLAWGGGVGGLAVLNAGGGGPEGGRGYTLATLAQESVAWRCLCFVLCSYFCLCCSAIPALGATPSPAHPCLLSHLGAEMAQACVLSTHPFGLPAKPGAVAKCVQVQSWLPVPGVGTPFLQSTGPNPEGVCAEDPGAAPANVPPLTCAHLPTLELGGAL